VAQDNQIKESKEELAEDIVQKEWDEAKKAKIRAYEQLHEIDVLKKLKESKGPFTKQGDYINYHEWHAAGLATALTGSGFLFSNAGSPNIGGAMIYFYLFFAVKVVRDCHHNQHKGPKWEVWKNFHYYLVAGFLTAFVFIELGYTAPEVSLGLAENLGVLIG